MVRIILLLTLFSISACTKTITAPRPHSYETDDSFTTGEYLPSDSLHNAGYVTNGEALTKAVINAECWGDIQVALKKYCK